MTRAVVTDLHHRIDGPEDAPALVLGPSLGTDLHLFDAQVELLAPRQDDLAGGRGLYFDDPAGHHFEVITRRYEGSPGAG